MVCAAIELGGPRDAANYLSLFPGMTRRDWREGIKSSQCQLNQAKQSGRASRLLTFPFFARFKGLGRKNLVDYVYYISRGLRIYAVLSNLFKFL